MIDKSDKKLSINTQCKLLSVNRSTYYYDKKGESAENLKYMRLIDEIYLNKPYFGSRGITRYLKWKGFKINRKRVRRLMNIMGISAIYQKPKTSVKSKQHKIFPYLLRKKPITQPDQVWCADISYIPMKRGFVFLIAIMDWHSRYIVSWRLSNTMDVSFCKEALVEALSKYNKPEIFNTDQGSQFTSVEFTETLINNDITISMDGKRSFKDNIFIERFWRTLKYEEVYLKAYDSVPDAMLNIGNYIWEYNNDRPHSSVGDLPPSEVYFRRELSIQNSLC